ncbi:MAG: hypothetical protein ACK5DV_15535 [Planctomycetota bacterium]
MPDLFTLGGLATNWGPEYPNRNATFSTTMGGSTSFLVGAANGHTFGASLKTSTNFNELLRLIANPALSPLHQTLFNLILGGGESAYSLGNKKSLAYRASPNFTVDRYYKGGGMLLNKDEWDGTSNKIKDIKVEGDTELIHFLFPAFFSTTLCAWNMVLVYYYDIGKATNGVVTGSVQQDGKLSEDRANVGTEKERDGRDESFYKTGDTLMMALGIYQTLGVPIMKLLEAIAFAAKSAAGSGGLAVGYTGLLAWMTYRTSKALAVCLSPVIITLGLLEATLRFVYTLLKPLGIGLVQLYRHISNGLATLFSPELLTVES